MHTRPHSMNTFLYRPVFALFIGVTGIFSSGCDLPAVSDAAIEAEAAAIDAVASAQAAAEEEVNEEADLSTVPPLNAQVFESELLQDYVPSDVRRVIASPLGVIDSSFAAASEPSAGDPPPPGQDVMSAKLQDAIDELTQNPNGDEGVYLRAVDQAVEVLFMSNLVILPTAGVPEADQSVQMHEQALQDAIDALGAHVDPNVSTGGTEKSREAAWEARNFLQIFQEAADVIGQQTQFCDPQDTRQPGCELLLSDDEAGVDIDQIHEEFSRALRSPFPLIESFSPDSSSQINPLANKNLVSARIQEAIIVPDAIADGECSIILKEIQGVRALVRKKLIPIWVEPWYARAQIVGFRTVWVIEFVPAEFLKTISYCNVGGTVVQDVDITIVNERELLSFWRFLQMDVYTTR